MMQVACKCQGRQWGASAALFVYRSTSRDTRNSDLAYPPWAISTAISHWMAFYIFLSILGEIHLPHFALERLQFSI